MKKIILSFLLCTFATVVNAQMSDIQIQSYLNQLNSDSIQNHISQLENFGTRWAKDTNRKEIANYITKKFESYNLRVKIDSFYMYWDNPKTWQYNIIGILDGTNDTNSIYMIGAHYDAINPSDPSKAPGADDNASGIAAMFDIARVMKNNNYHPTNSIYFVGFAAEEQGVKGSGHLAGVICPTKPIYYLLVNDMISNNQEPDNSWKVKLHTYDNSNDVSNQAIAITNTFTSLTDTIIPDNCQCTDSSPFFDWGTKTIFIHEYNFSPFYHSENDLVANTDKNYCKEVCKISFALLLKSTSLSSGISDNNMIDVKIFPNPVKDFIHIISNNEIKSIKLYNTIGIKLFENEFRSKEAKINTSNLTSGIYIITVNNSFTKKIVIELQE
ncbi:MAG: M20/M25/M40 family metallo-hydrolase [Bacteroidota bacterium]